MNDHETLLGPDDPPAVGIEDPMAASPVLFVSDHAGRAIPRALGTLGLDEADLRRHIACDIGIHGVTTRLARMLGATHIHQPYSRLVIDCNRRPGDPQSIAAESDGTVVPGNLGIGPAARARREREILEPYQREIARELAGRKAAGRATAVFAMHSCTDRLRHHKEKRPWHIGVIAVNDWRIGDQLIALLVAETGLCVGRNQPYSVNMEADYTIPIHCEAGGVPYVEIEIRQDLIGEATGQAEWAERLARIVPRAVARASVLAA